MGTTDAVVHREGGNRDGQSGDSEPLPPSLVRVCMWCVRAYCACVQSPLQRAPHPSPLHDIARTQGALVPRVPCAVVCVVVA